MDVDLKSAIDDRRVHHQLSPGYVQLEEGFPHVSIIIFIVIYL